jgi:hypothetical protein
VVAAGIRRGVGYEETNIEYEARHARQWAVRRMTGEMIRGLLDYRRIFAGGLQIAPAWVVNRMWTV